MSETRPADPADPEGADTVQQLGEDVVLAALREVIDAHNAHNAPDAHRAQAPPGRGVPVGMPVGPGDDAAVLRLEDPRLVATTDTMSQDQDFRPGWWAYPAEAAHAVGTKAAAQNLSDLSAMGARPVALLVSLTLPPQTRLDWAVGVMSGIAAAATAPGAAGCVIAGGDLGSGDVVSVTITALGTPTGARSLLRSGAQPGDQLAVCGPLGRAAAGLAALEGEVSPARGAESLLEACLDAQRRPAPDLTAGPRALASGATAGLDVSDGLLRDADRLARASEVALVLEEQALAEEITALGRLDAHSSRGWVLGGGEDYALLATFPGEVDLPEGFRRIGEVRSCDGAPGVLAGGTVSAGWDSLRQGAGPASRSGSQSCGK